MRKVYCCGDSFAAGTELLDYRLPSWPGYKTTGTLYVTREDKNWSSARHREGVVYFGSDAQYRDAQKEASWCGELSRLDNNITVINGSRDGISIAGIANRTLADLLSIYAGGDTVDTVFIQLTSASRLEIYNSTMATTHFMSERTFGWIDTYTIPSEYTLAKATVQHYRARENSIKYLYNMCMIKNAVKGITGKYPVFLASYSDFIKGVIDPILAIPELASNNIINELLVNSGIQNIPADDIMETIHLRNNCRYTPISHFEGKTHQLYAAHIYEEYLR